MLSSAAHGQEKRPWAQSETQEAPFEHQQRLLICEGEQALAVFAERDSGIFIHREIRKPSGHGSGQLVFF